MSLEESDIGGEPLNGDDAGLEKDQILESLSRLRLDIFHIETTTGPSKRTVCMRDEIKRLEIQLAHCRDQANEHVDKVSQDKL